MLIGLNGPAGSGKDTAAAFLQEQGYERRAFGAKIYTLLEETNPVVAAGLRVREVLSAYGSWEDAKRHTIMGPSIRNLLIVTAEGCRRTFGSHFWVDQTLPLSSPHGFVSRPRNLVISDVRKRIESDRIHSLGGVVLRIERHDASEYDPSEQDALVDATLTNNGPLDSFKRAILAYVEHLEPTC